jgi:hypothetical protein
MAAAEIDMQRTPRTHRAKLVAPRASRSDRGRLPRARVDSCRAHRTYRESQDSERAKSVFLALIDRGTSGIDAAMAGTSYAQASLRKGTQSRFRRKR